MTDVRRMDVSALGACIRLQFADDLPAGQEEAVRRAWSGAETAAAEPDEVIEITASAGFEWFLSSLSSRVTMAAIAHQQGSLVMLHAGGVAVPDGRVVAFVGPSGRGKTTLTAALSREYGYVTDETIGVAADLSVHPHRKPLSIINGSGPKRQVSPIELGARELPSAPLRLAGLVLLERHEEPTEPWLEPVTLVDGIVGIAPETSYLSRLPSPLQRLAQLHDAVGGIQRLHYSDANSVAALVPEMVGGSPTADEWRPATALGNDGGTHEVIEMDGRMVAMVDREILVLDGIAPTIWRSLSTSTDMAALVSAVVHEHGHPPAGGADVLVSDALAQMRRLLRLDPAWPFPIETP